MQSHELLREVFQECSPKQVAAELGLSLSMIYKWAEPADTSAGGSGSTNPLDRIDALLRCTKDRRLVQWICQRAGGFFILNPKTNKPHPDYLIPATNEIVQEFIRSEEHTSELQSRLHLVCRLLLEKKKQNITKSIYDRFLARPD